MDRVGLPRPGDVQHAQSRLITGFVRHVMEGMFLISVVVMDKDVII